MEKSMWWRTRLLTKSQHQVTIHMSMPSCTDPPAPVKPADDVALANTLTAISRETLSQNPRVSSSWIPDLQKLCEINAHCCLKLISFGVICYRPISKQFTIIVNGCMSINKEICTIWSVLVLNWPQFTRAYWRLVLTKLGFVLPPDWRGN